MAFVMLDSTGQTVIGVFGTAQNDPTPPGYAVIADNDARLATFQQQQVGTTQVEQLVAAGVSISASGNPTPTTVNGTYACIGSDWDDMTQEALYITTFGAFSAGQTSLVWTLPNNTTVTFATTANFLAVARGIGDFLTGVKRFVAGQQTSLPAQPVSIP